MIKGAYCRINMIYFNKITVPFAVLIACALCSSTMANDSVLTKIHNKIIKRYANIEHVEAANLEQWNADDVVIFDVREKSEYDVSHIDGAIQVEPDINSDSFIEEYSDLLRGKTVVFYCSVGRRSSGLLSRIAPQLKQQGIEQSYNLTGGIFRWHNEDRAVFKGGNSTPYIHPYNFYWGRLIEDKKAIKYK